MAMTKVLVCDDSNTDRSNLERIVSGIGCTVVTASNGKEAVEKAKAEIPNMIFVDIVMPEMDGYETCRLLTNTPETKDIPVIFVTSKNQKADRIWAQMQGGKDLVAKPYEDSEIESRIKQYS